MAEEQEEHKEAATAVMVNWGRFSAASNLSREG